MGQAFRKTNCFPKGQCRPNEFSSSNFPDSALLRYINNILQPNFEVKVKSVEDYSLNPYKYHHGMKIFTLFSELLENRKNVDVVLSCEDELILCHQVILSMNSFFFRKTLLKTNFETPIIMLDQITPKSLRFLLIYIYLGQVLIDLPDVQSFTLGLESLELIGPVSYSYGTNSSVAVVKNTAYVTKSMFPGLVEAFIGLKRWQKDEDADEDPDLQLEHWPDLLWMATLKTTPSHPKMGLFLKPKKDAKYYRHNSPRQKTIQDITFRLRNYVDSGKNVSWFRRRLYVIEEEDATG